MSDTAKPRVERHDGWTPERRKLFLEELAASGSVTGAARVAGKAKSTAYTRRLRDAAFAAAWDMALEMAGDDFEAQLRDRVLNGVEKTLHYQGTVFGTERVYSDHLAVYMLSRLRPVPNNPIAARRAAQRPARAICDTLTDRAVRALKARPAKT